jgi:hypothetical protein
MLSLCPLEVARSIDAQQGRNSVVGQTVQQQHAPAERLGRNAHTADRVPDVVLAIAEGALTVFPRLAPDNGGKANEEGLRREPLQQPHEAFLRPLCSELQRMLFGCVVIKTRTRRKAGHGVDKQIGFGRVQVSAGRIASQRPADFTGLLPGRNG